MENVVGVRFQEAGRIYYFTSGGYDDLAVGEYVVVETSRGLELARIVIAPDQVINAELTEPLKPITRLATDEDLEQAERLKQRAEEDVGAARARSRELNLPIKIVSGGYNLDGSRLTLFFSSEARVDFRELVRDLSSGFGAQIQLRQIGPRDQAKIVGGYGRCGRRLCCSSWLINFPAISIKMAKEQDLPLNPSKISGQCGRLLCCLSYENELYRQVKQALPRPGTFLSTPTGTARVQAVNVPREIVTLYMLASQQSIDVPVQELGLDRGLVRVLEKPPIPALTPERAQPSVIASEPQPDGSVVAPTGQPPAQRPSQPAPPLSASRPPVPEPRVAPSTPAPRPRVASEPASAPAPAPVPRPASGRPRRRPRRGRLGPRPPQA